MASAVSASKLALQSVALHHDCSASLLAPTLSRRSTLSVARAAGGVDRRLDVGDCALQSVALQSMAWTAVSGVRRGRR